MGLFHTHEFPFPSFSAYALSAIFVSNIVILSLLAASLALGPGTYSSFLAIPICVVMITLIIMGLYCIHRVKYPERDGNRMRSLVTFSALSSVSLINSLMLVIRIPASIQGSLETDFGGIPHPRVAVSAVIAVSCFSTIVAFFGFYVSQNELPPLRIGDTLTPPAPPLRKASNTVISLYRQPAPHFSQEGIEMKLTPPRTIYDDWEKIDI